MIPVKMLHYKQAQEQISVFADVHISKFDCYRGVSVCSVFLPYRHKEHRLTCYLRIKSKICLEIILKTVLI